MYQHIEPYVGDPILSLVETFIQDTRAYKVNLSIGIYFDEIGKLSLPNSVQLAFSAVENKACGYLPMEGHAGFRTAVTKLLFGENSELMKQNRLAVVQTLGGSGALKLGADFLHDCFPDAKAYISDPTWDNHRSIFEGAGIEVGVYPYYDADAIDVKFDEMLAFVRTLPEKSILILHPCCHNPTGVDLNQGQWDKLLAVMKANGLIAFMDMAYQGFGGDFEQDAYAIRKAVALNVPLFVSSSFSKNMSLYGERVGALSVVAGDENEAELLLGRLKFGVRRLYSSPPVHGALIAHHVLANEEVCYQWQQEVYAMRDRIRDMRQKLYDILSARLPERNFSYLVKQRGMFSYTGLSERQVNRLRDEFAIYLLQSGRLCIAGLNSGNIDYVADCLARVFSVD